MQQERIASITLNRIRPNPHNPRTRFSGPEFDAFVENIRAVGVLQPILVRPVDPAGEVDHEIVFGGRRFSACSRIAEENGGPGGMTIPCQVRTLTDDEAIDLMVVENLQRDDLTPLEEAAQFKLYVDQHGPEIVEDLAERVKCSPSYIRRRLLVQSLPKPVLAAWDRGAVKIGHLEQLARLKDRAEINEYFRRVIEEGASVRDIRRAIEWRAPSLADAKFDLEKAGCPTCQQCSDAQKSLFELPDTEKSCCLDRKCFKRHQNDHLLKKWKKSGLRRRYRTNGFRFYEDLDRNQWESFSYSDPVCPAEKCLECAEFVTVIDLDGSSHIGQVCLGPSECFKSAEAEIRRQHRRAANGNSSGGRDDAGSDSGPTKDDPRVSWHGEYFREAFYKERLPEVIAQHRHRTGLDDRVACLTLFCIVSSHNDIHREFALRHGLTDKNDKMAIDHGWFRLDHDDLWKRIEEMPAREVSAAIRRAATMAIMSTAYGAGSRRHVADHFGIDLAKEWRPTEEYLKKKTKGELLDIIEGFGLDKQDAAMAYLATVREKSLKHMKKTELVGLFLADGVDLFGVVPSEILA